MASSLWWTLFCAVGYTAYAFSSQSDVDGWSAMFGSSSDHAYTVTSFDPYAFVTRVCGRSDEEIDAIKAVFSDGAISELYGNVEGGNYQCLDAVPAGQCITDVALHVYDCETCTKYRVQTLQFTASDGSLSGVLGSSKGVSYTVSGAANRCLAMMKVFFDDVGVFSSGYQRLVGIQFYFASTPAPTLAPTATSTTTSKLPIVTTTTASTSTTTMAATTTTTSEPTASPNRLQASKAPTAIPTQTPSQLQTTQEHTNTLSTTTATTADSDLISTTGTPIVASNLETTSTTESISTEGSSKQENSSKSGSTAQHGWRSETGKIVMLVVVSISVVMFVVVFVALYCHYFGGDCAGCFCRKSRKRRWQASNSKENDRLIVEMESATETEKTTKAGDRNMYVLMDATKN